jgi:precorrin-3B synthase
VVVTPWRGVLIPGLAPATAAAAEAELRKAGLITDPESPWAGATACTGLPGCAKSRADVQADAMTVLHSAPRGDLLPVHWVGCERRCGRPAGAAVEVLALGGGQYRLAGQVHRVDDLPAALAAARRNA